MNFHVIASQTDRSTWEAQYVIGQMLRALLPHIKGTGRKEPIGASFCESMQARKWQDSHHPLWK